MRFKVKFHIVWLNIEQSARGHKLTVGEKIGEKLVLIDIISNICGNCIKSYRIYLGVKFRKKNG